MIRRRIRRRGQGMTEYIIIVALIAIAAIGVVTIFGDNIRDLFAGATNALASVSCRLFFARQLYKGKGSPYYPSPCR